MKVLKQGDIYAPEHLGRKDILIEGSRIARIADHIDEYDQIEEVEKVDLGGHILTPGYMDIHVHITGGGGESGPATRVPEASLSVLVRNGITTVVGLLGTDYLFCDETFDGLDPVMRQAVKSIFAADMEDRNLTPIIASHNLRELEDICDHVGLLHKGGILLSKDLDDMKLNIHKIQCVLKPDMKPEDLTSLDKVNVEQRGSLCTITVRGSRSEVEAVMASYEPVFFECIPLSLEEIFISETEVAGYDIRKLIL